MRGIRAKVAVAAAGLVVVAIVATSAIADGGPSQFNTSLDGYNETLVALSTTGNGTFTSKINNTATEIEWSLTFGDLEGTTTQAHIHFGTPGQTGGVSLFLCTNLGNGPAGTQACPSSGTVSGTWTAADVVGPAAQGIGAGQLAEVIAAMREGAAYVNVHSSLYQGGEIRGPLGKFK